VHSPSTVSCYPLILFQINTLSHLAVDFQWIFLRHNIQILNGSSLTALLLINLKSQPLLLNGQVFLSLSQVTSLRLPTETKMDIASIISIQMLMKSFQQLSLTLILHTWVYGCTGLSHTSRNQTLVETKIKTSIRTFLSSTVKLTSSQQLFHSSQNTLLVLIL
jgi:hypothetical protein